ncbi:MFS general substrate transporter [Hyaloscypha bicolor E]|uniref:MFS general substrate transporter n=1 Tax=Hyaloscypha bicolor E TaxID=1095630 RepID=A0A2J6SVL7_9HELO|nr:MFS general substrate transporter [Hyaloscypha bicolor E]PMD54818.1 MFS general substrate transporter [Hyaloscypha bicolor E]
MATSTMTQADPSSSSFELQPLPAQNSCEENDEVADLEETPPDSAVEALQKWNSPRINMFRVPATFWSFFVVGMNDGSYGLEEYYGLSYTIVSLIFLSPFAGYTIASGVNNMMHIKFGQRGVAIVGPACHLISYIVFSLHPPYPVLVVMFIFVGFGNGLIDAAWCAWIGNMANSNEVSGFLQACYALGATVAPLIATAMISKGGLGWYAFYYIMIGASALELTTSTWAFWRQTGSMYQAENPQDPNTKTGRTREALKNKVTWLFALFIFGYVGAEVSLGGWIVVFMTKIRHANAFASGASATGFWGGMTVGRLFLSFLTARLGEFCSVLLYLGIAVVLELIFWLVPSLVTSAVTVALLGVVMGPMFPTAIVLVTKLLPRSLHVGTIGFGTAFGGSGGAVFPFIVGAIAQKKGVKTLQPIILALLAAIAALWCNRSTASVHLVGLLEFGSKK